MNIVSKIVSFVNFGTLKNAQPIPAGWYPSFAQATEAAKSTDKLVLVKVHADWCGYCKHFAQDVATLPLLTDYLNEHFVCARVVEGSGEGRRLKKAYKVVAYPAFLVFRDGKFVGKARGYESAQGLIDALNILCR